MRKCGPVRRQSRTERRADETRSAITMAQSELSTRRGDDTAELRARYNQLCAALTMSAGTNSAVAERVLQELQALAQQIAFRQAERDSASHHPPAGAAPTPAASTSAPRGDARPVHVHGKGNVIAFRCRVKGRSREKPRASRPPLSALTDRTPVVAFESGAERPAPAAGAAKPRPDSTRRDAARAAHGRGGGKTRRRARAPRPEERGSIAHPRAARGPTGQERRRAATVGGRSPPCARPPRARANSWCRWPQPCIGLSKLLAAHPQQDRR